MQKPVEAKQPKIKQNYILWYTYFVLHLLHPIPEFKMIVIFKNSEGNLTKVKIISMRLIESVWSVWFNEHITQETGMIK